MTVTLPQHLLIDNQVMLECFLNCPEVDEQRPFALNYETVAQAQKTDVASLQSLASKPTKFGRLQMSENTNLICCVPGPNLPFKTCIPDALLDAVIRFSHLELNHIGMTRLRDAVAQHFYHPHLQARVGNIARPCDACQRHKSPGRGHGLLPARTALILPWQEVAVDLMGPWTVKPHGQEHKFHALTSVDAISNCPETFRLNNKTSQHAVQRFENSWLARHPKPLRCTCDRGSAFVGHCFQTMLDECDVVHGPTAVKNPLADAICEKLHQTAANAPRVSIHARSSQNVDDAAFLIDTALSTAACLARAATHSNLKISPGALIFHRNMMLHTPIIADLHLLQQQRQKRSSTKICHALIADASHMTVNQLMKSCFSRANLTNLTLKLQVHALFIWRAPMERQLQIATLLSGSVSTSAACSLATETESPDQT
jgi:hypothetical protein